MRGSPTAQLGGSAQTILPGVLLDGPDLGRAGFVLQRMGNGDTFAPKDISANVVTIIQAPGSNFDRIVDLSIDVPRDGALSIIPFLYTSAASGETVYRFEGIAATVVLGVHWEEWTE